MTIPGNYHTHTQFCDGSNTAEEMIGQALSLGFSSLGFSSHCDPPQGVAMDVDAYLAEISSLQEKYRDKLEILRGVELDNVMSPDMAPDVEYRIGSTHMIPPAGHPAWDHPLSVAEAGPGFLCVDYEPENMHDLCRTWYDSDYYALAADYFRFESAVARRTRPAFIGHFDLVTRFNDLPASEGGAFLDESDPLYLRAAGDAMEQIIQWNGAFERMDILILLFWLIGSIYAFSSYLFQGQQLLKRAFSLGEISGSYSGSLIFTLIEAGLIIAIYPIFSSVEEWNRWFISYACYIDIPLSIGIPVIIWCCFRIRSNRHVHPVNPDIQIQGSAIKDFSKNQKMAVRDFTKFPDRTGIQRIKALLLPIVLLLVCSSFSGCTGTDSIEDRAYVKELHISSSKGPYEFLCVLSYISEESASMLDDAMDSYSASAESIQEYNDDFQKLTDCSFDYSHLQGIYLDQELYNPTQCGQLLQEIRASTKAVLSTPIYYENARIGDQQEITLGDWLKYNKEHSPE